MDSARLPLLDSIGAWIVVVDGEGRVAHINQACSQALGISVDEARGVLFWDGFADANERERVRVALGRLREEADAVEFEAFLSTKLGDRRWLTWSVRRLDAAVDGVREVELLATGVDRTERKRAEEQLPWFERIVTASEDAIVSSTPAGVIRSWNPAAERIFGFTAAEAIGSPASIIYPEGNVEDRRHVVARMMRGEIVTEYDALRRRKDGTVFPVAMTGSLIRGGDGELLGILGIARDITEQKRAHETREWLANIVNSSSDAIVGTDLEGIVRSWNAAAERIYGYPASEIVGHSGQILYPDDLADERRDLLDALREGRSIMLETVRRHRDGSLVPVLLTASPLKDRDGRVVGTSSIVRDLRERNELRARLDEEQRWLKQVIDSAPVGIVLVDAERRVNANQAAERILGIRLDPQRGHVQYQARIRLPDGRAVGDEHLFAVNETNEGVLAEAQEVHVAHGDGAILVTIANAALVFDAQQRLLGRVLVFTDITAQKRTQKEREELAATLERLIDVMPVGVWVANASGDITRINATGEQIWDGAPVEPDAYRSFRVDGGEPIPIDRWPLIRALREGETVRGEVVRIRTFDGREKTVLVSATPLLDNEGRVNGAVLVNEDITELRETEEQLRRAVRSRDEVLDVVAHDLRNPLNAIAINSQVVLRALRGSEQVETLQAIMTSVKKMNSLIQDLLDIKRAEAGALQLRRASVEIASLARSAIEEHAPLFDRAGLRLESRILEPLPTIDADALRLSQVFSNLLGNAIKFTPRGGGVSVAVEPVGDEVRVSVEDTGPGISADRRDRVFDRFWQGNPRDSRGIGLGLAICRSIVEAHGGRIWVESESGRGSAFRFAIPVRR